MYSIVYVYVLLCIIINSIVGKVLKSQWIESFQNIMIMYKIAWDGGITIPKTK